MRSRTISGMNLGAEKEIVRFITAEPTSKDLDSVSDPNIFIFFCLPGKFWSNLSEITALLPLTIPNFLNLKYKFKGQRWGQLGGRKGQMRGGKTGVEIFCPWQFSNTFEGLDPWGQRGSDFKGVGTRSLSVLGTCVPLFQCLKNRLLILSKDYLKGVGRHRRVNGLDLLCGGSWSGSSGCVA
jgi:hypothetical protein